MKQLIVFLLILTACSQKSTNGVKGDKGDVGLPGDPGPPGESIVGPRGAPMTLSMVTPCGANSSAYKEVLLCMPTGELLASFSDARSGYNTRLALIPAGTYVDTDRSNCVFTVDTSLGYSVVSWVAQNGNPAGSSSCEIIP